MNTMEERLWNYIDGTCSDEERKAIDILIEQDAAWRAKFEELMNFDQQLVKMEMDEPSMGFTYKVMEGIRAEHALQPLKAGINKNIIKFIGGFFIVTIVIMMIYLFVTVPVGHVNLSKELTDKVKLPQGIDLSVLKNYINGSVVLKVFFVFDTILALFLTDAYLRRKRLSKQV
jgi:hypothetical protein